VYGTGGRSIRLKTTALQCFSPSRQRIIAAVWHRRRGIRLKTKAVQCFSPSRQRMITGVRHRRPKYSIENHGLAMLFAEP